MNEKVQYWIDIAEYDMETAKVMLEGKRFLYVGFMCQQVIEKIIKGQYVLIKKENPPYTHNLTYLAMQCGIYENMPEDHKDVIDMPEPLNVEARYPTHKEKLMRTLNYERCKEIVQKTEVLYQWIKKKLSNV